MPIRPDLRSKYSKAAGWPATRQRILERAGGKFEGQTVAEFVASRLPRYVGGAQCEQCGVPDRHQVWRGPAGTWCDDAAGTLPAWRTCTRAEISLPCGPIRHVYVVLTVAHLNHVAGDNRDDNLRALCQWCHLNYDKLHHKQTREARKDAARPLLVAST